MFDDSGGKQVFDDSGGEQVFDDSGGGGGGVNKYYPSLKRLTLTSINCLQLFITKINWYFSSRCVEVFTRI